MENRDEIVNDGRNAFLKRRLSEGGEVSFEVKMLMQNEPARFLKMGIKREREEAFLEYNITGLVSLESCEGELVLECLFGLLSAISNLTDICTEYLLSADKIDLNPACIYLRRETGQFYFCYDPEKETTTRDTLLSLSEFLMKTATPIEEEDVLLVYGLYRKMREDHVTLRSPLEYWRETHRVSNHETELGGLYTQESHPASQPGYMFNRGGRQADASERQAFANSENPYESGIYEKIGIDSGESYTSFDAWKRTHRRKDIITSRPEERVIESVTAETALEPQKKKKANGLKRFFRGKLPEITIGIIALAVSAWFLFS